MEPQKIQNNPGSQLIQFEKTDSYSKIFLYYIQDFLNWWYVKMPVRHLRILGRLSVLVDDNLSMSLLFKNFFVPWHRDNSFFGYFFGVIIKILYLPFALIIYLLSIITYLAVILIWLILPVATIVFSITSFF
jgi:hypothetical protein